MDEEITQTLDSLRSITAFQCWTPWVSDNLTKQLKVCKIPCDMGLSEFIECLIGPYGRVFLTPRCNIGTLDTPRAVEKRTQAGLSRFHVTGGMAVLQSGNLENLLNPNASKVCVCV